MILSHDELATCKVHRVSITGIPHKSDGVMIDAGVMELTLEWACTATWMRAKKYIQDCCFQGKYLCLINVIVTPKQLRAFQKDYHAEVRLQDANRVPLHTQGRIGLD